MIKQLAAAIALALPLSAFALSNSFSYQGSLNDGGSPAAGSFDLQFQLQTSAGANVGAPLVREDVAVAGGLFSVELDFGAAITSADFRLQIGVRPGASTGAYTTLSPTTNLRPTPQAQVAGLAAEAVTVSPNSITSAAIQDSAILTSDIQDNTILSADIGDLQVGVNDVNFNEVQLRVGNACVAGSAIRSIASNGDVTCVNVSSGGTVTSVASGAGLSGGPITTTGTLSIATGGVTSAMIADGTVASVDIADGSIAALDLAANSVATSQIVDGSVGAADVDTSQVQQRVSGTCAAGSGIRDISATGAVTCEPIPAGSSGTVTSVASGAGLSGGPITTSGTLSIATGGVTTSMIADGTVANADLAANAVNAGNIVDGAVGTADIQNGSVASVDIADGGVASIDIADSSIVGADIADGSIGGLDLASDSVNSLKIVDGSVSSVDVNTAQVQARVTGTCAAGSSINTIAANGTVTCETDDAGPAAWSLTGNAGTNPASNFLGTTDAVDLAFRVNNQRMLLIDATSAGLTGNWVGGYSGNTVDAASGAQTIAGGGENETNCGLTATANLNCDNRTSSTGSTIGGGIGQRTTGSYATIAGGISNEAGASAAIAGGARNQAAGPVSAVPGGLDNTASGIASLAAGSASCAGGDRSFALGERARTRPGNEAGDAACRGTAVPTSGDANGDEGSFVWADSQGIDFVSTGPNQFLLRADGGMGINTSNIGSFDDLVVAARAVTGDGDADLVLRTRAGPSMRIFVQNDTGGLVFNGTAQRFAIGTNTIDTARWINTGANGAHLTTGGTWTNGSSRQFKDVLGAFDPGEALERVLGLGISRWRYKGSEEGEHVGPMAEDFRAAFGLGADAQHIATVDADGVALAAIQGLNQKLEAENASLRAELAELRALVLERMRD